MNKKLYDFLEENCNMKTSTADVIKEAIKVIIDEAELWCKEESEYHYILSDCDKDPKVPRGGLGNSGNDLVKHLKKTFKK